MVVIPDELTLKNLLGQYIVHFQLLQSIFLLSKFTNYREAGRFLKRFPYSRGLPVGDNLTLVMNNIKRIHSDVVTSTTIVFEYL